MEATIDSVGRVVLPKQIRDSLGLLPGTIVDISVYGSGVQICPGGRTARLVESMYGHMSATSDTVVTDEMIYAAIDAGRK